jgi:hypothetical protein
MHTKETGLWWTWRYVENEKSVPKLSALNWLGKIVEILM